MQRSLLPIIFAFAGQFATAQTASVVSSGDENQKETVALGSAGNLVEPVTAVITTTADAGETNSGVQFFEGFVSETSEEALLDLLAKAIIKDPEHACEIVKKAIVISDADADLVAKIVETACIEAPEKMRIIAQCAIAAFPDALEQIQQVLAKLDPAAGDGDSSKSGKEIVSSKSGKETLDKTPIPRVDPPTPLRIRIDTPPPLIPFVPWVSPRPATPNDLR
jgi:hypothetical protein